MQLAPETPIFRITDAGVNSKIDEFKMAHVNSLSFSAKPPHYVYFTELEEAEDFLRRRKACSAIRNLISTMNSVDVEQVLKTVTNLVERAEELATKRKKS